MRKGMPLPRRSQRRGDAGVGHGDDDVGRDAGLAGQLAAHLVAVS